MSSDEQIPAVADIENAKKSDGPSSAGEHNVDKVNGDDEEVPQSDSKAKVHVDGKTSDDAAAAAASNDEVKNGDHDEGKTNNGKRDIDQVDQPDEKTNGDKGSNDDDEEEDEAVVSTTSNKKVKIIHLSTDETAGENDDASASAKVPNEELTVV